MSHDKKLDEMESVARQLAKEIIVPMLPENCGFALLVFEFHDSSRSTYIANAEREDMIKALRETADTLEKNQDVPPGMGGPPKPN